MKFTWRVMLVVLSSSLITWPMKSMEDEHALPGKKFTKTNSSNSTATEQLLFAYNRFSSSSINNSFPIISPLTSTISDKSTVQGEINPMIEFISDDHTFSDEEQNQLNKAFQALKLLSSENEKYIHKCNITELMKSMPKLEALIHNNLSCKQCENYQNQLNKNKSELEYLQNQLDNKKTFVPIKENNSEIMQTFQKQLKKEYDNKISRIHKTYFSIIGFGLLYFATPTLGKIIQGFLNSK